MTAFLAATRVGLLATTRSPALRAAGALALVASLLASRVVAFAFAGDDALAAAAGFGTAALFAPVAALFAGISVASGDRGGEGLAPVLRGAASAPAAVAATALGVALAAAAGSAILGIAAAAGLRLHDRPFHGAGAAGAILAAMAAALPAAAAGVLLGTAAPRALAGSLALLLLAAALGAPPAADGALPGPEAFLLARDAAFGALPATAVLLSAAASLLLAAAACAAATAVLRVKDLAPRAGST